MFDLKTPYEIAFKTIGHEWAMQFRELNPEGYAYGLMTRPSETRWFGMALDQMTQLRRYFKRHVAELIKNPSHHSDPIYRFLAPYETQRTQNRFKLQALSGKVAPPKKGSFELRIEYQRFPYPYPYRKESVSTETGQADVADCFAFASALRRFANAGAVALFKTHFPGKTPSDLDEEMRNRLEEIVIGRKLRDPKKVFIQSFWDRWMNIWTLARFHPWGKGGLTRQQWANQIIRYVNGDIGSPPEFPPPYIDEAEFTGGGRLPALELSSSGRFSWSARYWLRYFQEAKERAQKRFG